MKLKLNSNLQLGFGSALLILILVGIISYATLQKLLMSNHAVAHSNLVIEKLERTLSVMKDAETGQRGYLLSGDRRFLEPYNGAYRHALGLIAEAKVLTKDDIGQQINMASLKAILEHRLDILRALIEKKQRNETITPADLSSGKMAMDALRVAINKAETAERQLLSERTASLNRYVALTPFAILFAIGLAIIISLFFYYTVMCDIKEKERLQKELYDKERETAAFNEELTAANEEIAATNEELMTINEELAEAQQNLAELNRSLEDKVEQRTKALMDSEEETQALNEELTAINEELAAANEEMLATNEELAMSRQELQKSEALFRSIAVNIPKSLIILVDTDQRFVAVEGDLMHQLAYDNPDYIGRRANEVIPVDRYNDVKPLFERALSGEHITEERKGADGTDLRVDFVPLRDDKQAIYALLVIALDISDIKQAEERSAKLAAIVESSDDAIISKTLDGVITSWNRSAERLFGYTESEAIGQHILKLVPADRHEEEPRIIERLKKGERIEHFETLRVTKDGKLIDVSLTISPVKDTKGNIIGASKIARDISERKRDETRKNDFIGMVSHELKTPLTSLTALIQAVNVKLRKSEDPFLANAMDKATMQTRKMATIINGFLNISRLESSQIHINPERFDLEELLESAVHEAALSATSHKIIFDPSMPVIVEADPDKIGSVISNLLNNAVKYSAKGTRITINCVATAGGAQVSVKDQGIGIRDTDKERLFERFYRVEGEHTWHISGFGIGLYLSAEIIQRHGGKIWVESEFGVGSTFYFTLPVK
ncbi:PAS domain S-box protein [Mucilaginibacter sp. AK015]|uniref:PAS domain S-box protein n=1 Tax=Mucilaginibacter sp. AK015 TaxID=2723072 RepID=UPI00161630AE|nr:PAS domain S-box protein [Mucilaginibacter sp. AK015]MBB5394739.1 PAS domain S-box-containing protein [Mucilaginibacter sp. AK015]